MAVRLLIILHLVLVSSKTVNVLKFGAKGDGKTDDSDAIEMALVSLNGSGTLLLPSSPGQYAVSRPVVLAGNGVWLRGEGATPSTCGSGSALLALSAHNSTVVILKRCISCGVEGLLMGHATTIAAGTCVLAGLAAQIQRAPSGRRGRQHSRTMPAAVGTMVKTPPTAGSSVIVDGAFSVTLSRLWIQDVHRFVTAHNMANTVTILDSVMYNAWGDCGICAYGGLNQTRVDILQISRVTTNNVKGSGNRTVTWIEIGSGVNSVRLDNVGLINGGTGVRMCAPADSPPGESPGRPLFLFANDLEIDFPCLTGVALLQGQDVQISNSYIQGAGSDIYGPVPDETKGVGLFVGPDWNSEVMVVNTRFFGHYLSAVELAGGAHTLLSNNIISASSLRQCGAVSGVLVRANVSDFILQGNHIGNVFRGEGEVCTKFGVEIGPGLSDRFVVSGNTLFGNREGGLSDGSHAVPAQKAVQGNAVPAAA